MEYVKLFFSLLFEMIGKKVSKLTEAIMIKIGLEDTWNNFSRWFNSSPTHRKIVMSFSMIGLSCIILFGFYGCSPKPNL